MRRSTRKPAGLPPKQAIVVSRFPSTFIRRWLCSATMTALYLVISELPAGTRLSAGRQQHQRHLVTAAGLNWKI